MTRSKNVPVVFLLCLTIVSFFSRVSHGQAGSTPSNMVQFILYPTDGTAASYSLTVQSKTEIAMLMAPKTNVMSQLEVSGTTRFFRLRPPQGNRSQIGQEFRAKKARVAYYQPGEPDLEMEPELVERSLLVAGIAPPDIPVRLGMTPLGKVVDVQGVAASMSQYFKASIIEYPEFPLQIHDSWTCRQDVPFNVNVSDPPIWAGMVATFTLEKARDDIDEAEVKAEIAFDSAFWSGAASQAAPITKVMGTSTGVIAIRLSDGIPTRVDTRSELRIEFGNSNFVRSEQTFESRLTFPQE